jgi:hypothetical protein
VPVCSALSATTDERSPETSDVTSVVSLNGFLPSIGRDCPGRDNGGRAIRGCTRFA